MLVFTGQLFRGGVGVVGCCRFCRFCLFYFDLLLLLLLLFFRGGGCVGIAFYSSQTLFYPLCSELSTSDPNSSVGKDGGC